MAKKELSTPKFRASFASVMEPDRVKDKYSVMMMFPKSLDVSELQEFFEEAAKEAYGTLKGIKLPFGDGDVRAKNWDENCIEGEEGKYDNLKGHVLLNAASKFKPIVFDAQLRRITNPSEFYSGCYAMAKITTFTWEYQGKRGVGVNLGNVQKMAEGERFGKSVDPADGFEVVEETVEDI